ncbi:MAG: beta-galactosidase, partial [Planctomycetota bacterium]
MSMKPVRVAADHWNFELAGAGEPITPLGGNMLNDVHPGQGTLFDAFDAADCERRFAAMAELGLNCLRQAIGVNHVFDPAAGLRAEGMRHWDTFIGLAEQYGVYLMPVGGYLGGNDWFDQERLADHGRALDESCAFWEAFAGHYAGHPAIWAWDLRNELLYDKKPHMVAPGAGDEDRIEAMLKDRWPAWLEAKYGAVERMNRLYGAAYPAFADVPGSITFEEAPWDLRAYDFRCYLNERGYDWCKRQCEVIRAVAPGHMIVSGNNGWLSPDMDLWLANGFHNLRVEDLFDFVTFHPYPAWQCVPGGRGDPLDGGEPMAYWLNACIGMARLDWYNKPVVVQEYGWYGGGASRFLCDLPHRSEEEHRDYTRALTDALVPH